MALHRGIDGSEPVRPEPIESVEERRSTRTTVFAVGTLACPDCDAPVAPAGPVRPADTLACPYCAHRGAVREFLSLGAPTRPARVQVRLVAPVARWATRRR
jgi:hypothetical protein